MEKNYSQIICSGLFFLLTIYRFGFGQSEWKVISPSPRVTSQTLYSITYDRKQVVAVGDSGTIITTMPDCSTWTIKSSGTLKRLYSITNGNGLFVAVGEGDSILTSTDGSLWTKCNSGLSFPLYSVTYGNGQYVAVGYGGSILGSFDGISWNLRTSGVLSHLYSITYGNGMFVAVSSGDIHNASSILISYDGITWQIGNTSTSSELRCVSYGNNMFVAVGNNGTIVTSVDGLSWTTKNSFTDSSLNSVSFQNNICYVFGNGGTLLYSSEGSAWINTYFRGKTIYGSVCGDSLLLAVGLSGTRIMGTKNNWQDISGGRMVTNFGSVAFGNGRFIATALGQHLMSSSDGITWQQKNVKISPLDIAFGNDRFVAGGIAPCVGTMRPGEQFGALVTLDSDSCVTVDNCANYYLTSVAYGNGIFLATSTRSLGYIYRSLDGLKWTLGSFGALYMCFRSACYGNGKWVIIGSLDFKTQSAYTLISSDNGETWDSVALGSRTVYTSITYGNNRFVAVGDTGAIISSSDALTWQQCTSPIKNSILKSVIYSDSQFVAVGTSGTILTSRDGIKFEQQKSGTTNDINKIAFGNDKFVALGPSGTILVANADIPIGVKYITKKNSLNKEIKLSFSKNVIFIAMPFGMSKHIEKISIYTISGQKIITKKITQSNKIVSISYSGLSDGVYIFSAFYTDKSVVSKKFRL